MKSNSEEFDKFNDAMDEILKADPAIVKAAMEQEKRDRAAERKAKRSAASRVSSDRKG